MTRRQFVVSLVGSFTAPPIALAQQTRIARVSYLGIDIAASDPSVREGFGLRELGYLEGTNFVTEYRDAQGQPERHPTLAAELVALNVDVILTVGGGALPDK